MDHYMRDYEEVVSSPIKNQATVASAFATLMRKVYVWMALALVVSGLTAFYVAGNQSLLMTIYTNQAVLWGLFIAELALVIILSAAINKLSATVATLLFLLYAVVNGAALSFIFVIYTATSLTTTFLVTAGTFAAMAVAGTVTHRDLTKLGGILFMGLIGIIIAALVNLFLRNSMMDMIVSAIGVLIFVGLTAYDSQKIKNMMLTYGSGVNDFTQKLAVLGALTLYLDFINLFLYLLRFLGRNRD